MSWREPDHPHQCAVDGCPRGVPDEGSNCWAHVIPGPPMPTPLGRELGLRPGPSVDGVCRSSVGMSWSPFAATLHAALEARSRPDPAEHNP